MIIKNKSSYFKKIFALMLGSFILTGSTLATTTHADVFHSSSGPKNEIVILNEQREFCVTDFIDAVELLKKAQTENEYFLSNLYETNKDKIYAINRMLINLEEPSDLSLNRILVEKVLNASSDFEKIQKKQSEIEKNLENHKNFFLDKPKSGSVPLSLFKNDGAFLEACIGNNQTMYYPVESFVTTSLYGIHRSFGGPRHLGVDMAAPIGTKIIAPVNGLVLSTDNRFSNRGGLSNSDGGGAGNSLVLLYQYQGTMYLAKFYHLNQSIAKPGQIVKVGDEIAEIGNSGRSTGPHLHFQLERFFDGNIEEMLYKSDELLYYKGETVNPANYLEFYHGQRR